MAADVGLDAFDAADKTTGNAGMACGLGTQSRLRQTGTATVFLSGKQMAVRRTREEIRDNHRFLDSPRLRDRMGQCHALHGSWFRSVPTT